MFVTALPTIAQMVGTNRIIRGVAITHPTGDPSLALDEEFADFCPVRAVEAWLEAITREKGPLLSGFKRNGALKSARLSEQYVSAIVKAFARAGGLDPALFGGHSLRAGYVTTARQQGVDWASIMEQTGHRRLETAKLYTRYTPDVLVATRQADVFRGAFKKKKEKTP